MRLIYLCMYIAPPKLVTLLLNTVTKSPSKVIITSQQPCMAPPDNALFSVSTVDELPIKLTLLDSEYIAPLFLIAMLLLYIVAEFFLKFTPSQSQHEIAPPLLAELLTNDEVELPSKDIIPPTIMAPPLSQTALLFLNLVEEFPLKDTIPPSIAPPQTPAALPLNIPEEFSLNDI